MTDTIFAEASARGRAGISVLRLSGPRAHEAVAAMVTGELPPLRHAALRLLHAPDGEVLDEALVVLFAEGASFTGEATAELHLHGAPSVVAAVQRHLSRQRGLRPADPGEFTRRALEAGKLDLAQVEGLGDLLTAETEAQRRQSLRIMRGALSEKVEAWRLALIRARALVEVTIDFSDEDVPETVSDEVLALIGEVRAGMLRELAGARASERIRDGFEIAIIGRPNAGKSTLLNALAGREAALTSEIAGTTRDVIEVRMDIGGLAVTLIDTAGMRDGRDPIEVMGIARARARAESADLRLILLGPGESLQGLGVEIRPEDLILLTKADLSPAPVVWPAISAQTGEGLDALLDRISATLGERARGATSVVRERHRLALERSSDSLAVATGLVLDGPGAVDRAAEELRLATHSLETLLGRVDVELILDEIFRSFCLGK